ncbi:hypothetical protein PRZ48_014555 [Zasmidium cellare]|uniref:Amine oxidase n=1 Tax=Zasmidium cellare TaxID=395010 RepID=A0ABR0DYN1_ZASCE|nr:hypothetical protein PRZ48_014555 [Zasmidium cellare]
MSRTIEGHIYTAGSGHSTGLTTDAVTPSSTNIKSSYDVIIIGAGFAGLVAARDLSQTTDLSILLLEARDCIGGRTWTARAWGEEFEMGGTWVHWSQPHVYTEISRYGLHTSLKTSSGSVAPEQMFQKPRGSTQPAEPVDLRSFMEKQVGLIDEFFTIDGLTARELVPFPHDPSRPGVQAWEKYDHLSMRDRLEQLDWSDEDRDIVEGSFNAAGLAPGRDIAFTAALKWWALGGYDLQGFAATAASFKLGQGGMTGLARRVLAEYNGDRLFGAAVKKIEQQGEGVKIHLDDGKTIAARRVVCTIPLNCLKDIEFDPPMSALRQEAFEEGHINRGTKFHFHIDQVTPGWASGAVDDSNNDFLFAMTDHNGTQASGTHCVAFGYSGHLPDPSDDKRVLSAFHQLKSDASVKGYLTHHWAEDRFAKGTWFCSGPGQLTRFSEELQKGHGRVHMASGDWADGWRGFVDGAIEQGRRAALQVAEALKSEDKAH